MRVQRTHIARMVSSLGALALVGLLAGCGAETVVVEAAKAGFEDRKVEELTVDAKIKLGIVERLAEIDKELVLDVSTDVWKGEVMLTGMVSNAAMKSTIAHIVTEDARVTRFYNEIIVVTEDQQAERRAWREKAAAGADKVEQSAGDYWIETKISARLLAASGVTSPNYRWRSVLGTVYIIGEAGSAEELARVLAIIRDTERVKAVRSHVPVRSQS